MLILLPSPATLHLLKKKVTYEVGTVQIQSLASQKNNLTEIINAICGYDAEVLHIKVADTNSYFFADLIVCSTCFGHYYAHHQELKSIIQWLLPVVFRAVVYCKPASCKPDA